LTSYLPATLALIDSCLAILWPELVVSRSIGIESPTALGPLKWHLSLRFCQ
jgi:hypothetical protein